MIIYLTYNDQPSGVYWSQVADVVNLLDGLDNERVRLVALVSVRGYLATRRAIRAHCPGAVVLPMVPRVRNWRFNSWWLSIIARRWKPTGIIGRGIFATALGLELRSKGRVERVCFDGRAAYGAEWTEFRLIDDDRLIRDTVELEREVVWQADSRMAVSHALVDHWRGSMHYTGDRHVVIPCTLGRAVEGVEHPVGVGLRERLGWGREDIVLAYSGTVAGWQSMGLLRDMIGPWLAQHPTRRMLFLSDADPRITELMAAHPGQVVRQWVPHEQVLALLRECDFGLLLRDRYVTNQVASPTKFAEYLSAGLPVLISAGVGDFSNMVERESLGRVLDPGDALVLAKPTQAERDRLMAIARDRFTKEAHLDAYGRMIRFLRDPASEWASPAAGTAPLVSIIVPSFNKGTFIGRMVETVLQQTDGRWELHIVDDASTDGSPDMLKTMTAHDPRVRITVLPENRGANHCRNVGIAEARGRYVLFLDADDLLDLRCVERRLADMNGSGLDMSVFTMEVFSHQLGDHGQRWVPDSKDPLRDFFLHDLPWQTMQPLWDAAFVRQLGGFDPAFSRHQDVELHTRALLEPGVRYQLLPGAPDCYYRIGEERKVIDPLPLLRRFCDSAVRYHAKFRTTAMERGMEDALLGIIHRTYLQVLLHAKDGRIDRAALKELEDRLFNGLRHGGLSTGQQLLFRAMRGYNLLPVRIPGVNRLIFEMITRNGVHARKSFTSRSVIASNRKGRVS